MASSDCSCGYYDAATGHLWTDSIIVYFNESGGIPTDIFKLQDYTNNAEKSWNAYFRQGATPANAVIGNTTFPDSMTNSSLRLFVNPSTPDHVVVGGGIETLRRDIIHGSFRTWMRSPQPNPKGTALTFQMHYNETQSLQLTLQNTNNQSTAWVSNLMADDFPDRSLGVNYTVMANSSLPNYMPDPWGFYEQRVEWNSNNITFSAGQNVTRLISGDSGNFFGTPSSFELKHWSIGDEYSMGGPPMNNRVAAEVGWVRSFFNTSSITQSQRLAFDSTCRISQACDVNDYSLRGSSAFPPSALQKWEPSKSTWSAVWPAIAICAFSLCFTTIVTLNTLFRRLILERGVKQQARHGHASPLYERSAKSSTEDIKKAKCVGEKPYPEDDGSLESGTTQSGPSASKSGSEAATPWNGTGTLVSPTPAHTRPPSIREAHLQDFDARWRAVQGVDGFKTPDTKRTSPASSLRDEKAARNDFHPPVPGEYDFENGLHYHQNIPTGDILGEDVKINEIEAESGKGKEKVNITEIKHTTPSSPAPVPRQRIDYLAGLVAVCSLLVTAIHFALTFVPALVFPDGFAHYPSEVWARKTIGPYIFNQVWVGLFFATSTRFLVMKFLKTGNLANIAEKVVARVPRLFIPIGAVVLLQYFLIDCGAIHYLQYLPSVTWSTWPYTVEFQNFGIFINEFLELIFLVPNAVPRIVFNYCIGVLWTIPVQLQGTWQALLGAIVIVECKTPYKRFGYYTINIIYNWYTQDWGSFFWFGLLLTDIDVIFKYRVWLYARPWAYYPILSLAAICAVAGLTNDLISAWTPINFAAIEFNIHPDLASAVPIVQSSNDVFPPYYTPTIKHLLFCLGFQAVVELSTTVQKALSNRFFVLIFPHIFTIYLIHGFIFWSLGAAVCVAFNGIGLPYWATSLLTAVICYLVLGVSVIFITPVIEVLGKDGAANAWRMANAEIPIVKWKPTLYPFPKTTLEGRPDATDRHENGTDVENSPEEVRQIEHNIAEENAVFIERAIEDDDFKRLQIIASMRGSKLDQALSRD